MIGWNEDIKKQFKYCGKNVFIGNNTMFAFPQEVHIEDNVRIDPFCWITSRLTIRSNVQITSHAVIEGGLSHHVEFGNWTTLGYGSKLLCGSEDYSGDFGPVNTWGKNKIFSGDIHLSDYSVVASDVIVMPGVIIPIGCAIGAKSFVYTRNILEEWSIFIGNPLKLHKKRNKENICSLSNDPSFLKIQQ